MQKKTPAGFTFRVLITDDNSVNLLLLEQLIHSFGIETKAASGGFEALSLITAADTSLPFDLVFMDYLMPDLNGDEVTKQIRALPLQKQPVIIGTTADNAEPEVSRLLASGMNEVIFKPVYASTLKTLFARYLPLQTPESGMDSLSGSESGADAFADGSASETNTKTAIYEPLFHALEEKLPGLSVSLGIHTCMGQPDQYYKVILSCIPSISLYLSEILLHPTETDILRRSVHSLKSVFTALGVPAAVDLFAQAEAVCRDQKKPWDREMQQQIQNCLQLYRDTLQSCTDAFSVEKDTEPSVPVKKLPKNEYQKQLSEAKQALRMFIPSQAADILNALISYTNENQKEILRAAIKCTENFQYEEALHHLEQLT